MSLQNQNLPFNRRACPESGEIIECSTFQNIQDLKCAPESLKELMKFYILKDGCQTGMFGLLRQQRSVSMDRDNYWFTRKGKLGESNIIFATPLLKTSLELIAEKTPFISGDQLEIIIQIIKDIRIDENRSKPLKTTLRNSSLLKRVLDVLLAKHIIGKIRQEDNSSIMILNRLYGVYYNNIKQIYYNGHPYQVVWNEEQKNNIINLFFALYNFICSHVYTKIELKIPNNINLLLSGEVTMDNLFSSYENVVSLFVNKGYIQLKGIQGQFYGNTLEGGKKKKTSSLSEKTVDQLRSMMKKHGKKCSKDGKRLTKDQLIRVLKRC